MSIVYTLEDIRDFFEKKNPKLKWNYEIYDRKSGLLRASTTKDFEEANGKRVPIKVYIKDMEFDLGLSVSNCRFLVFQGRFNIIRNYSEDWINSLHNEHNIEYFEKSL